MYFCFIFSLSLPPLIFFSFFPRIIWDFMLYRVSLDVPPCFSFLQIHVCSRSKVGVFLRAIPWNFAIYSRENRKKKKVQKNEMKSERVLSLGREKKNRNDFQNNATSCGLWWKRVPQRGREREGDGRGGVERRDRKILWEIEKCSKK